MRQLLRIGRRRPSETAATASSSSSLADAFPVTLEHKFGTTKISEPPSRVVSVGFNDHDTLLALGVTPVAVRDWYGDYPYATWPWAQNELGDAQLAVLSSAELNIEAVAAQDPDLIVGIFSGMTKREYELLSQIAPTVATPRDSTTSASAEAASCSGRAESTPVAGVTEGVVDAVDGGALVIVPGLLIESHDAAEATSPRDGADPHPPLTGQPPQLGPQRLPLVPLIDVDDAQAMRCAACPHRLRQRVSWLWAAELPVNRPGAPYVLRSKREESDRWRAPTRGASGEE